MFANALYQRSETCVVFSIIPVKVLAVGAFFIIVISNHIIIIIPFFGIVNPKNGIYYIILL